MSRIFSIFMILAVLALGFSPAAPVQAQAIEIPCPFLDLSPGADLLPPIAMAGSQPDGSNYCVWSLPGVTKAVIFAHGYVDPTDPRRKDGLIPTDQLVLTDPTTGDKIALPNIIAGMGYAFVVPSYSKNGLAVKEGIFDVWNLALTLKALGMQQIYLVGASEGGLVTAYALEQHLSITNQFPEIANPFTAGVSTCGPVGDFVQQINYWGDFRVAYDYYFVYKNKGPAIKTNPISIDPQTITDWGILDLPTSPATSVLQAQILAFIQSHPGVALQLIASGKAPIDPLNPNATIPATILGILDYNIKATDEAREEFSGNPDAYKFPVLGNPYSNIDRWLGTWFDFGLNSWIRAGNDRFKADPNAISDIGMNYQTNGRLAVPLVTLHTTGDPIVPYWQELTYAVRVWRAGRIQNLISIPVARYGHCAFTPKEAIFAFALAVFRATGTLPIMPTATTSSGAPVLTMQDFTTMMKEYSPMQLQFNYMPSIRR